MNIMDLVEKYARLTPDATAFVEIRPVSKTRKEVSWLGFQQRTDQLANALLARGITEGKSVFLLAKNSLSWLETYFAVLKTGAWIVPLNFRFTDKDLLYCAKVVEPAAFIFDSEFESRILGLRQSLPWVQYYICTEPSDAAAVEYLEDMIQSGENRPTGLLIDNQRPCALYFTSGTTGDPKPVLVSNANLFCTALSEGSNNPIGHRDSLLMMPPLYHLAIGHLLGMLANGGKTVLLTEKISPQYILETLEREKISYVFLLVPWAMDLLQALERRELRKEDYDLSAWHFTQMGAQPIPPSLVKRLKALFPEMLFDTTYGLSESTGPGVTHLGVENGHKVGAIGREALTWSVRIVDPEGRDVEPGAVGELVLRGDGVMLQYYQNPELTKRTIENGWLHTGDLGRRDQDGFIYLVDRLKDLIISGGENIYPTEVEQVILHHPVVYDVAVIGTPDERLGEIVTAVVQTKSGMDLSQDELNAYCEENLPRYKRPRAIIFDDIPRSPTGKIEKTKIRKKYC